MRKRILMSIVAGLLSASATTAQAQYVCSNFLCPGNKVAKGTYPAACMCGAKHRTITCAKDFACADPGQVGVGAWPNCGCKDSNDPDPPPGDSTPYGTTVHPGIGGVDVCNQFYKCPPRTQMAVDNDTCVCQRH